MGIYTSPQAGDPILADLGAPYGPRSYYVYSVWGDFEPAKSEENAIRADKGILANEDSENLVREAVQAFSSQEKIFKTIVDYREKRKSDSGYLELYKTIQIRKPIDFSAYFDLLSECKREET
jgi:hypothetical protein